MYSLTSLDTRYMLLWVLHTVKIQKLKYWDKLYGSYTTYINFQQIFRCGTLSAIKDYSEKTKLNQPELIWRIRIFLDFYNLGEIA